MKLGFGSNESGPFSQTNSVNRGPAGNLAEEAPPPPGLHLLRQNRVIKHSIVLTTLLTVAFASLLEFQNPKADSTQGPVYLITLSRWRMVPLNLLVGGCLESMTLTHGLVK